MKKRLAKLFTDVFPGSEAELETFSNGRISGKLVWGGFAKKNHAARQRELAAAIKRHLTEQEQLLVSAILTFTPDEIAGMNAR